MSTERLDASRKQVLAVCLFVLLLLLGGSPALAKKGPKVSVADDPSQKQGSPALVLIEISDFQ